jgi:hypothetical protein
MPQINVSVGELLDKVSILYIKNSKIHDEEKLKKVEVELLYLLPIVKPFLEIPEVDDLYTDLMGVNFELWDIEDALRLLEKRKEFEVIFVDLARQVYKFNDQRSALKEKINVLTNSEISEVKSYKN